MLHVGYFDSDKSVYLLRKKYLQKIRSRDKIIQQANMYNQQLLSNDLLKRSWYLVR